MVVLFRECQLFQPREELAQLYHQLNFSSLESKGQKMHGQAGLPFCITKTLACVCQQAAFHTEQRSVGSAEAHKKVIAKERLRVWSVLEANGL